MLDEKVISDIRDTSDVGKRSQRILLEIQPFLQKVMDEFVAKHAEEYPELTKLKVHTYENTLKTTISDAKNPKYREQLNNYSYRSFVELCDQEYYFEPYNELILSLFVFELNLRDMEIQIHLKSDFYPFVSGVSSREESLSSMIEELNNQDPNPKLKIWVNQNEIDRTDLISTVQRLSRAKKTPNLYFGHKFPIEGPLVADDLVKLLYQIYEQLTSVRTFLHQEIQYHVQTVQIFEIFKQQTGQDAISVFNHTYDLNMEEAEKARTHMFKQPFSLYESGQLITEGFFTYTHYDPYGKEGLGVYINSIGCMFAQIQFLIQEEKKDWFYKKAFRKRGKQEENQQHQALANEMLRDHDFTFDKNESIYMGTYNSQLQAFTEPVLEVKKRFILAALIFAHVSGDFILPKDDEFSDPPVVGQGDDYENNIEEITASFDLENILKQISETKFTFSTQMIRDLHLNLTSLEDKHFVILNGISGTGKTKLTQLYANAVYGLDYDTNNPFFKIIPVRPDWLDSTALLGYYSAFEKRYMMTPFLQMLIHANQEKDKPHFIVLDEMNLARVEYYLSDYLSAVESKTPLPLHEQSDIMDVPNKIQVPNNLYLIGTVNVDETTHSISDKVLDRAFVMTLSDVDTENFWEQLDKKYREMLQEEWELILETHQMLVNYELHFGYRTMKEMLLKLYKNKKLSVDIQMTSTGAVDTVIAEKVLPKLRGDESIATLIEEFSHWAKDRLGEDSGTVLHLERMRKELERYGATQFWR